MQAQVQPFAGAKLWAIRLEQSRRQSSAEHDYEQSDYKRRNLHSCWKVAVLVPMTFQVQMRVQAAVQRKSQVPVYRFQ